MVKPTIFVLFMFFGLGLTFLYDNCPKRNLKTVDVDLSKVGQSLCTSATRDYCAPHDVECEEELTTANPKARRTMPPGASTTITVDAYFLIARHPDLDMHYVCSNDPKFASIKVSSIFVQTRKPTPPKHNAKEIKELLKQNGFNPMDLEVVNNCNCDNIPSVDKTCSSSKIETIEEFFAGC